MAQSPSRYTKDLTGKVFGKLTVVEYLGKTPGNKPVWRATCECGMTTIVLSSYINSGGTTSCGCVKTDELVRRNRRNSQTANPRKREYNSWISAKRRCLDSTDKDFPRYGAVGVSFHSAWAESFSAFYDHIGPRPDGCTLDRIDGTRGYEPGNVRWATPTEQAINRKSTRWIATDEGEKTLAQVAEKMGVTPGGIAKRLAKYGNIYGNPRRPR